MTTARLFLLLTGAVYAAFGVWGLLDAPSMMQRFDVHVETPEAKTAIRAIYGGFLIGAGLVFAFAALAERRVTSGLQAVLILSASILAARVFGMMADGSGGAYHLSYAALEVVGVLISGVLLWRRRANEG